MSKTNNATVTAPTVTSTIKGTPGPIPQQIKSLEDCEQTIRETNSGSFKQAEALYLINKDELFKPKYNTFPEYCKKQWDFSRSYGYRLIDVHSVMMDLAALNKPEALPKNEGQARIFAKLDKAQRIKLAEKVAEEGETKKITSGIYTKIKKALFPDLCAAKRKKAGKEALDGVANPNNIPNPPSVKPLMKVAEEFLKDLENEESDDGPMGDELRSFIDAAKPWYEWEMQQKAKN